jgi:hypothetical protein
MPSLSNIFFLIHRPERSQKDSNPYDHTRVWVLLNSLTEKANINIFSSSKEILTQQKMLFSNQVLIAEQAKK